MRWSRAARTPSLILRRRVGCPTRRQAKGDWRSMSWLVSYTELGVTDLMPRGRLCRGEPGGARITVADIGKPGWVLGITTVARGRPGACRGAGSDLVRCWVVWCEKVRVL